MDLLDIFFENVLKKKNNFTVTLVVIKATCLKNHAALYSYFLKLAINNFIKFRQHRKPSFSKKIIIDWPTVARDIFFFFAKTVTFQPQKVND